MPVRHPSWPSHWCVGDGVVGGLVDGAGVVGARVDGAVVGVQRPPTGGAGARVVGWYVGALTGDAVGSGVMTQTVKPRFRMFQSVRHRSLVPLLISRLGGSESPQSGSPSPTDRESQPHSLGSLHEYDQALLLCSTSKTRNMSVPEVSVVAVQSSLFRWLPRPSVKQFPTTLPPSQSRLFTRSVRTSDVHIDSSPAATEL